MNLTQKMEEARDYGRRSTPKWLDRLVKKKIGVLEKKKLRGICTHHILPLWHVCFVCTDKIREG